MKKIALPLGWFLELDNTTRECGEFQGFVNNPKGTASASLVCARDCGEVSNFEGEWSIPRAVMNEIHKDKYTQYE
jgi:hypothetical protein